MSEMIQKNEIASLQPDHYVIRVKEHLSAHWAKWFEGLSIEHTATGETILSGSIPDQAALHGFLARIRDLNLTLISAIRVDSVGSGLPEEHPEVGFEKNGNTFETEGSR